MDPIAEPVPADEKLCPPARPQNMPSDFTKARTQTGRALGKHFEDVSFEMCVAHFRSKLNGNGK